MKPVFTVRLPDMFTNNHYPVDKPCLPTLIGFFCTGKAYKLFHESINMSFQLTSPVSYVNPFLALTNFWITAETLASHVGA